MDKYVAAEFELAELMGMLPGELGPGFLVSAMSSREGRTIIPKWARDDDAAFKLMVEHSVSVRYYSDFVSAYLKFDETSCISSIEFSNHQSVNAATRFCIIYGVIYKLRYKKSNENPHSPA